MCDFAGETIEQLDNHIMVTHTFTCNQCQSTGPSRTFQSAELLLAHKTSKHGEKENAKECKQCRTSFSHEATLKNHICNNHEVNTETKCNQCDFKCNDVTAFITHILNAHRNNSEVVHCPHCEYKSIDMESMNNHIETDHVEIALLGHVAANQTAMSKNFEKFKGELTNILNVIIEDHNAIKQELFIHRQNKHGCEDKMDKIDKALVNLTSLVTTPAVNSNAKPTEPIVTPEQSSSSFSNASSADVRKPSVPQPKTESTVSKVCVIGDSISGYLDHRVIANSMNAEIRATRAYSSLHNTTENEASEATKFPEKHFDVVINAELKKAKTDLLIVQSGSVDISNMKTKGDNPKKFSEYFKQQTILSANSLFNSISNALTTNLDLKEVILLKQSPRYAPSSSDPQSIKSALSNFTMIQSTNSGSVLR